MPKPLNQTEYIMATFFKSVPESSRMKTPLQEHNNGLQFFPSADGEGPVTARAARSRISDIPIYCHQGLPKVPQGEDQTWGKNAKTLNRSAWSD